MRELLLQLSTRFSEIARFDPETTQYAFEARSDDLPIALDGHCCLLDGVFVALYRLDQRLYLALDGHTIPLDESTKVIVSGPSQARTLSVSHPNMGTYKVDYPLTQEALPGDTTAFVDQEDFDFGLFLSNVAADVERQQVLLGID